MRFSVTFPDSLIPLQISGMFDAYQTSGNFYPILRLDYDASHGSLVKYYYSVTSLRDTNEIRIINTYLDSKSDLAHVVIKSEGCLFVYGKTEMYMVDIPIISNINPKCNIVYMHPDLDIRIKIAATKEELKKILEYDNAKKNIKDLYNSLLSISPTSEIRIVECNYEHLPQIGDDENNYIKKNTYDLTPLTTTTKIQEGTIDKTISSHSIQEIRKIEITGRCNKPLDILHTLGKFVKSKGMIRINNPFIYFRFFL